MFIKRPYSGYKLFSGENYVLQRQPWTHRPIKQLLCNFLTTTCRSYFFSKVAGENYPRGHMTSFRQRYNVYNFIYKLYPSIQLHIDFLSALKRLCLSQGIQHYETINSVKSIFFRILSNGVEQLSCRKCFGEYLFRILHFV